MARETEERTVRVVEVLDVDCLEPRIAPCSLPPGDPNIAYSCPIPLWVELPAKARA